MRVSFGGLTHVSGSNLQQVVRYMKDNPSPMALWEMTPIQRGKDGRYETLMVDELELFETAGEGLDILLNPDTVMIQKTDSSASAKTLVEKARKQIEHAKKNDPKRSNLLVQAIRTLAETCHEGVHHVDLDDVDLDQPGNNSPAG